MDYYRQGTSLTSQDDSQKLELFFGARNLADLDFISVTDSFLILKLVEPNKPEKTLLKTKVYQNDLNPDYAETVTIDYFFEIRQKLKIQIFHEASPPKLVGRAETTLGQIFGSPQNGIKKPLNDKNNKVCGTVIIKCQKVAKVTNNFLEFSVQGYDFPSSGGFFCFGGSTDPFFRIYRKRQKDQLLIYESQPRNGNSDPIFKLCRVSERRLCKNDPDSHFQIRFYNYSNMGNHSEIGRVVTSVNNILDPKLHQVMKKNSKVATMRMNNVKRYIKYTFADYVLRGLQLMLITCIDFTASNGSIKHPQSLHYLQPGGMTQYEEALQEVANILLDYDSDKLVPVYGFGAKVKMPNFNSLNKTDNCFPLNGNPQDAHVFMVEGIIQAYRSALPYLELSGPTYFNQLLQQAIEQGKHLRQQRNQYMIIFILTDGEIHDRNKVVDQIIECCNLPISLIIVGIGNGPFDIMEELDDDDCNLRDSKGRKTTRDLVQFVQFKKFKNNGIQLARQVLEELPRQVQQYYQIVNISPMDFPPPQLMPNNMGPNNMGPPNNMGHNNMAPNNMPNNMAPNNMPNNMQSFQIQNPYGK